jgi:hypothetical protein
MLVFFFGKMVIIEPNNNKTMPFYKKKIFGSRGQNVNQGQNNIFSTFK